MRYTPDNIRKPAKAYCNGVEIDGAVVVDTERGEVIFYPMPARIKKNADELYTRKVRGECWVVDANGVKNP